MECEYSTLNKCFHICHNAQNISMCFLNLNISALSSNENFNRIPDLFTLLSSSKPSTCVLSIYVVIWLLIIQMLRACSPDSATGASAANDGGNGSAPPLVC